MTALESLLTTAAAHPWYRTNNGGGRLADWPVLTKTDLYARLAATRREADGRGGIYYSRSGGTTGQAVYFPTDVAENHEQRRLLAGRLAADGVLTPRTVAMNVCPIVRMYRAMEIMTEFCEHCGSTVLPMAAIAGDAEIYEQAMQFGADTLIGMPSRLVALARHVRDNRLTWDVDTVLFGGEFLQPGKRQFLREVFRVKRFCGVYGSAELGVVAWHPDLLDVPVYHFPRDILHVEVVAPDADGYGAVVATNLVRRRFPIVRYDTGDVGRVVAEGPDAVSVELRGRRSDSFLIGDDYHSLADFADLFRDFAEYQVQIDFDADRRIDVIRFCLNAGGRNVSDADREALAERVRDRLGAHPVMYRTEVAFVGPEGIVRSREGIKTPAVVDRRGR